MGKNRFVKSQVTRIELSEGDWIEIKDRLSYGEQAKLTGTMTPSMVPSDAKKSDKSTTIDVDWAEYAIQKMAAYLVAWSFKDADDRAVPLGRDSIFALDQETASEVEVAIDTFLASTPKSGSPTLTIVE